MLSGGVARLLTVPLDITLCHEGFQNALVVSFRIYRIKIKREHVTVRRMNLDRRVDKVRCTALVSGVEALLLSRE